MCHPSECGYGHPTYDAPGRASHHHWGCCCASGHPPPRRFLTREEVRTQLEEYLKNLQAEAKGVEERIAGLSKDIGEG